MKTLRRHWSDYVGFLFFISFAGWQIHGIKTLEVVAMLSMPALLDSVVMALAFLTRGQLVHKLAGIAPKLAAYAGTFGFIAFWNITLDFYPGWISPNSDVHLQAFGGAIGVVATLLSLVVLFFLRPAVSLEPQARVLVTSGPYRFARHPLYATYVFGYVGLLLQYSTVAVAVAVSFCVFALLVRARFEEQALSAAFPEYQQYRARVWMFGPCLTAPENWQGVSKGLSFLRAMGASFTARFQHPFAALGDGKAMPVTMAAPVKQEDDTVAVAEFENR